jgi:hypothetical protein
MILRIREQWDEMTGTIDREFHRTYRRGWLVETDDDRTGVMTPDLAILLTPPIPLPYASHPNDLQALADKPAVTLPDADAPQFRKVSVTYSTRSLDPSRQNQDQNQSPVFKPPVARWGHVVVTRLFTKTVDRTPVRLIQAGHLDGAATFANIRGLLPPDATGWPVQNTAGSPFIQAPETEKRLLTLTVTRNELDYDPDRADSYIDSTNNDIWIVDGHRADPGEARCVQYSGERAYEKQVPYHVVTYGFEFDDDWDIIMRDAAPHGLDGPATTSDDTTWKQVARYSPDGSAIPMVNLNGNNGGLLPLGQPPVDLGFRRCPRMDFGALNLINL